MDPTDTSVPSQTTGSGEQSSTSTPTPEPSTVTATATATRTATATATTTQTVAPDGPTDVQVDPLQFGALIIGIALLVLLAAYSAVKAR